MTLKNRIVMPAMASYHAAVNGEATEKLIRYHEERAKGGVGMNIVEATYVARSGNSFDLGLGISDDFMIKGLSKLTDAVHRHDGKIAIQLQHGGRFGNPGRRFGGGRLRHGGFRGRVRNLRNGFFRSGGRLRSRSGGGHFGFRDSGSHGRIRLRIFSRRADLLLGSRKCRFFSSHFSTRFLVPAYAEAYKSRKYNHFMRNAEKISSKHATTPPCGSAKSLHPGTAAQFSGLFRPFVSACGPLRQCVWAQPDGPW